MIVCWVFAQFSYWEGSNSSSGVCWEVPGYVCICQKHLMLTDTAARSWAGETALSCGSTGLSSVQVHIHQVAPPKDLTHLIWGDRSLWCDQPASTFPKDNCRGFPSLLSCLMLTQVKCCVSRTGQRNTNLLESVSQYR